jgi:siroheme synthase-like protein
VGTGRAEVDHPIATAARERGVLVNTVDDIPFCDWSAPAILRRGDLTIAIGTAGYAPALASRLRDQLREAVGPEHGELLAIFRDVRPRIMASGRSFRDRRRLWYGLVDGPALAHLKAGRADDARASIEAAIAAWEATE